MKPLLNTFFFWVLATVLLAQVTPPRLLCISNDTVVWENTPLSCGSFLATQIYTGASQNGPFTELAVLTDPGQNRFHHPNPTGALRFYYLQYRFDCPGQLVRSSDTLDNRIPLPPST
ncbi:MAG: hypothetical protein HC821_05730, partial [Lewinella sp.]|nr:hypothetical protein [Lewinella sp.]